MRYQWLLCWLLGILAYCMAAECETTWGNTVVYLTLVFLCSWRDASVGPHLGCQTSFLQDWGQGLSTTNTVTTSGRNSHWYIHIKSFPTKTPSPWTVSECHFGSAFPNSNFKHKTPKVSVRPLCSLKKSKTPSKGDWVLESSLGFPGLSPWNQRRDLGEECPTCEVLLCECHAYHCHCFVLPFFHVGGKKYF